jgi:single-stranded DNA-binding protein
MSLTGLNTAVLVGNLAADVEIKTVETSNGQSQVAEATIYVRYRRNRDQAFRVDLSIWEDGPGWRALEYLKKGSLIVAYGALEPSPLHHQHLE